MRKYSSREIAFRFVLFSELSNIIIRDDKKWKNAMIVGVSSENIQQWLPPTRPLIHPNKFPFQRNQ